MRIFLGGRVSRGEFHELERDVRMFSDRNKCEVATRVELSIDASTGRFIDESLDNPEPSLRSVYDVDLFILCRSFPNEFSVADVETIRRVNPLAPIVLVAGTLCMGEERTGETFHGVRRFYLDGWRATGRDELERFILSNGSKGLFAQSPLATNADIMARAKPCEGKRYDSPRGLVAILTVDGEMEALLKDSFQNAGYETFTEVPFALEPNTKRPEEVARVVVDVVDLSDPDFPGTLSAIKQAYRQIPIVLLANDVRPHEREFYERRDLWGRVRVVGKPFDVDDLVDEF